MLAMAILHESLEMINKFKKVPLNSKRECSHCGETKEATEFFRSRNRFDGFSLWCKDCLKNNVSNWKDNNYEKQRNIWTKSKRRRRALIAVSTPYLSNDKFNDIKGFFDNKCAYCGSDDKLYQDHFHCIGSKEKDNYIIPSCMKCNSSKNDRDFKDWYKEQLFYSSDREETIYRFLYAQKTMDELYQ